MVHKKYTYKDGKRFGPYYYETKRVDGKIITTYLGRDEVKGKSFKKYYIALGILFVVLLAFFVYNGITSLTGKSILEFDTSEIIDDRINGRLLINLQEGELIPYESKLLIEVDGVIKEVLVSDLFDSKVINGERYFNGKSFGEGEGIGFIGQKIVYPEIEFELRVFDLPEVSEERDDGGPSEGGQDDEANKENESSEYSESAGSSEDSGALGEEGSESGEKSNSDDDGEGAEVSESSDEDGGEPKDSESNNAGSGSSPLTGAVIQEKDEIILGIVSNEEEFEHSLSEGKSAEIAIGSVKINGEEVSEDLLDLEISGSRVTVSTEYFVVLEGYGREFTGEEVHALPIELEGLGIIINKNSSLNARLVYNEETLAETSQQLNSMDGANSVNEIIGGNVPIVLTNGTNNPVNVSVNLSSERVVLGRPVKWVKRVEFNDSLAVSVEIPAEAFNVSARNAGSGEEIELAASDEGDGSTSIRVDITGNVISEGGGFGFLRAIKDFAEVTGFVIEEGLSQEIILEADAEEIIEIEYYTEGPTSNEEEIERGKRVTISSPDGLHYTDVLAFTDLDEGLGLRNSALLEIYWEEEDSYIATENVLDLDENGIYDYVEWNVPHLSNQTFEIIVIIAGEHLDENRTFISDIYDDIKEKDGNWSEEIPDGHYVRIKFERTLAREKDITVFPRITSGSPRIEVYEEDGENVIAEFAPLVNEEYNKVYLDGLEGMQDTFDLKIIDGSAEFDYIVDPSFNVTACGNLLIADSIYTLQNDLYSTGSCLTVGASGVTINGNGYKIIYGNQSSAGLLYGIATASANTHVANITIMKGTAAAPTDVRTGIYYLVNSGGRITNVDVSGNQLGIHLLNSMNNNISGVVANLNSNYGVFLEGGGGNNLTNITANSNSARGVNINSHNNKISGVTTTGNSLWGFALDTAQNNTVNDVFSTFNLQVGVAIIASSGNNLSQISSGANAAFGTYLFASSNNRITNLLSIFNTANNLVLASGSQNNIISNGSLENSGQDSVIIDSSNNNVLNNISISATPATHRDIYWTSAGSNGTNLIDIPHIGNYSFTGVGGTLTIEDTNNGKIEFLGAVNGSGTNLTHHVRFSNNLAVVESSLNNGLNKSANVTLYNMPGGFTNPAILREGINCGPACYNFTSLNDATVKFNVTSWSYYEIYESTVRVGGCGTITTPDTIYMLRSDLTSTTTCITIAANGVTFDGAGFKITYGNQSSATVYDGILSTANNTHIRDVTIVRGSAALTNQGRNGIRYLNSHGGSITNVNTSNNWRGIHLMTSNNNVLRDIVSNSNSQIGIIVQSGNNNSLYSTTTHSNSLNGLHFVTSANNTVDGFVSNSNTNMGLTIVGSSDNTFANGSINNSGQDGIFFNTAGTNNNILKNITIANTNHSFYDIEWNTAGLTGNQLIDMLHVGNYSFIGTGSTITLENTAHGKIQFLTAINGSGTNLTHHVRIADNLATVESSLNSELNRSANITLYNTPSSGLTNPVIGRNGVTCPANVCMNFTPLNAAEVVFNVTYWTNYSLIEGNTAPSDPVLFINSTDGSNRTLQDLNCFATLVDPDANAMNVSLKWYKNNAVNLTIDFNNSYSNGAFFNAVLAAGNTTKGESWKCEMRLFDGYAYSNWVNSSSLTILNTPPVVTLSSPPNGNVTNDRTPTFTWSISDDDNDNLFTSELNVSLVASSLCVDSEKYVQGISGTSHTLTSDLNCFIDDGDYYEWRARASDGEDFGSWTGPRNISIQTLVQVALVIDSINFGAMTQYSFNDTADDSPLPFRLENTGNVEVNVTIEGTSLWESVENPNQYFRYKADNRTNATAFNYDASTTTFADVPLTGSAQLCIAELNNTIGNNMADIDIYVEVPPNEGASIKSSQVTFTAGVA